MTRQEIMTRVKEVLTLVNEKNLNVSTACKSVGLTASTFYRNVCYENVSRKFILLGESYKIERATEYLQNALKSEDKGYMRYCIENALIELKAIC